MKPSVKKTHAPCFCERESQDVTDKEVVAFAISSLNELVRNFPTSSLALATAAFRWSVRKALEVGVSRSVILVVADQASAKFVADVAFSKEDLTDN